MDGYHVKHTDLEICEALLQNVFLGEYFFINYINIFLTTYKRVLKFLFTYSLSVEDVILFYKFSKRHLNTI